MLPSSDMAGSFAVQLRTGDTFARCGIVNVTRCVDRDHRRDRTAAGQTDRGRADAAAFGLRAGDALQQELSHRCARARADMSPGGGAGCIVQCLTAHLRIRTGEASPTPRSNSTAPQTIGTWSAPTSKPTPRSSSACITPEQASSPKAEPPQSTMALMRGIMFSLFKDRSPRVPGAAPRTSTPATNRPCAQSTVQPVRASSFCAPHHQSLNIANA